MLRSFLAIDVSLSLSPSLRPFSIAILNNYQKMEKLNWRRKMIVKNLRYTRERLGLKQKDLTTLFNVTYSTISGWDTGKDTIPLKQLIKYANKYSFSLDYLFGLTKICL